MLGAFGDDPFGLCDNDRAPATAETMDCASRRNPGFSSIASVLKVSV
jgi:hypothetical protein